MKNFVRISAIALCCLMLVSGLTACKRNSGTTISMGVEDGLVFGVHVGSGAYQKLATSAVKAGEGELEGFIVVTVNSDVTMVDMDLRPYFDGKNILGPMFEYTRKVGDAAAVKSHAYEPVAVGEDVTANTWRRHSMMTSEPIAQAAMTVHVIFAGVLDANAPTGTVARWSTYVGQTNFNKEVVYHFHGEDGNTYVLKLFIKQEAQVVPAKAKK